MPLPLAVEAGELVDEADAVNVDVIAIGPTDEGVGSPGAVVERAAEPGGPLRSPEVAAAIDDRGPLGAGDGRLPAECSPVGRGEGRGEKGGGPMSRPPERLGAARSGGRGGREVVEDGGGDGAAAPEGRGVGGHGGVERDEPVE